MRMSLTLPHPRPYPLPQGLCAVSGAAGAGAAVSQPEAAAGGARLLTPAPVPHAAVWRCCWCGALAQPGTSLGSDLLLAIAADRFATTNLADMSLVLNQTPFDVPAPLTISLPHTQIGSLTQQATKQRQRNGNKKCISSAAHDTPNVFSCSWGCFKNGGGYGRGREAGGTACIPPPEKNYGSAGVRGEVMEGGG